MATEAPAGIGRALQKVTRGYPIAAVMVLNTFVVFLAVNLFCAVLRPWLLPPQDPVTQEYGLEDIAKIYPNLSPNQITRMLYETWSRKMVYEPYRHFKEAPHVGLYVNVHSNGFRRVAHQGPWPPDPSRFNVFVFGGSTTFGYGAPDQQTVPSFLQARLAEALHTNVSVYNFGQCFYQSTQERLHFEQLLLAGHVPKLALFIDGLNDFYFAEGAPQFAEEFEQLLSGAFARKLRAQCLTNLPAVHLVSSLAGRGHQPGGKPGADARPEPADRLKLEVDMVCRRYLMNKELIERIAVAYGVRTCFVWQPVPTYKYDLKYHLFVGEGLGKHWRSKPGYERMAEIMRSQTPDPSFVWCADLQEALSEPLYVDAIHYTARMSELLARYIAETLVQRQLVP
jgi:hypothetical protein